MPQPERARVFKNGRSQAVRIPAEYRFETDEVYIRWNDATGDITLSENPPKRSVLELFAAIDAARGSHEIVIERDMRPSEEHNLFEAGEE